MAIKTLYGTAGDDVIVHYRTSDYRIFGLGGNDRIEDFYLSWAVSTDDFFFGGRGNDTLTSFKGSDVLHGGQGDDTLKVFAHDGRTVLKGGDGADKAFLHDFDESMAVVTDRDWGTVIKQDDVIVVVKDSVEDWGLV